jgi:tripartite-type tricarboxylate transporter receptor subunit TctC
MLKKNILLAFTFLLSGLTYSSWAAQWPEKPIRVIVPFAPGGTTDVVARTFGPHLSQEFGQPFVIDNRAGAGGALGAEIGARANPDGYTLVVVTSSYAANAVLYRLPYDPVKGIAPVSMISVLPFILAVHPTVKATQLKDFMELARSQPRAINFGSPGTGSTPHLAGELLQQMSQTTWTHIAYKGDGPALTDLLGGQIQAVFATELVIGSQIKAGKVRALGITTAKRVAALPDIPAIGEVVPGYLVDGWAGIWAPAGTSPAIIKKLNRSITRILKSQEIIDRLHAGGAEPAPSSPEEFAHVIQRDIKTWSKVVEKGQIQLN